MTQVTSTYPLSPHQWGNIFAILSLDIAAPFLPDMGLRLPIDDHFRSGLRKIINEYLAANPLDNDAESSIAEPVFVWLLKDYGRDFTDEFYAWGIRTFPAACDETSISVWDQVFRKGGLNGEKDAVPAPLFVTELRKMLAKRNKPSVYRIKPTTEWDKQLYERREYDEFYSAMELVQAAIGHYVFVSAWQEAVEASSHIDLDEVYKWGKEQAQGLGVPEGRLDQPGTWPSVS